MRANDCSKSDQKVYNQTLTSPSKGNSQNRFAALNTDLSPILDLLRRLPYVAQQPDEVISALAAAATRSNYRTGAVIFVQGEPGRGLFIIETGEVKISRVGREGREHILHVLRTGETFNDVAAMDGGPNPATAIARTDAAVWCIPRDDLRQIAILHPALAWALVENIARRARYLVGVVEDLGMRSVRGRLANLLLTEARAHQLGAVPRLLSQEEMASRLGTVREVVGRALKAMAEDGVIAFDRHRIVILDEGRLADEADA